MTDTEDRTDATIERGLRDIGPDAFAAAFETSPTPMVVSDPRSADDPVVWANGAFLALTGYTRSELYGRNCRMLQGLDSDSATVRRLRDALAAGRPFAGELYNYRKDGTPFWNGMTISQVRDAAGQTLYHFAAQADMTEKHRLEIALTQANDALERQVNERTAALQAALIQKTALLHEVDHRVKNNLQVISSLMLLKARRTSAGDARDAVQGMADRIAALSTAHRMLYSAGDATRFDFQEFASDFLADLAVGTGKGVAIDAQVETIAIPAAMAAPLALMMHEVATNAVRHAFPGEREGRLCIAARRDGDGMHLTIQDDGIGFDAGARNPAGFGHSLVEMVVRQLRGRISYADAAPGTRVEIVIPLAAAEGAT